KNQRKEHAAVRGRLPGSAVLTPALRLFAGQEGQSFGLRVLGQVQRQVIGAIETVKNVNLAADVPVAKVPDRLRVGRQRRWCRPGTTVSLAGASDSHYSPSRAFGKNKITRATFFH